MATSEDASTPRPGRPWWGWAVSVRALMVVVLAAGLLAGWYARATAGRREALATIRAAGGSVQYRDQGPNASGFWVGVYRRTGWELAREILSVHLDKPSFRTRLLNFPPIPDPVNPPSRDEVFAALGRLGPVEWVWIEGGTIQPAHRDALAAAGVATLTILAPDGSALDESLSRLAQVPSLRELHLRRDRRTVLPPATLRWVGAIAQLHHFAAEGAVGPVPVSFEADATTFARLVELESLMLTQGPSDGAYLDGLGAGRRLKSLMILGTFPTDDQLRRLAERAPDLEHLRLDGALLSDAGTEALGRLTRLKELRLSGRPGAASAMSDATLATVGRLQELTTLVVTCGRFTDRGLEALRGISRLESLGLGSFDSASGEVLGRLLTGRSWKKLGFRGLGITDDLLKIILTSAPNCTDVAIADSGVTDAGLAALVPSPVAQLDLTGTGVTDAGLLGLAKSAVRRVEARGTRVTRGGVQAFRQAVGRATVVTGPTRPEDEW